MFDSTKRRVAERMGLVCFLLVGVGAGGWVQWQLNRSFARRDPSGLTRTILFGRLGA